MRHQNIIQIDWVWTECFNIPDNFGKIEFSMVLGEAFNAIVQGVRKNRTLLL